MASRSLFFISLPLVQRCVLQKCLGGVSAPKLPMSFGLPSGILIGERRGDAETHSQKGWGWKLSGERAGTRTDAGSGSRKSVMHEQCTYTRIRAWRGSKKETDREEVDDWKQTTLLVCLCSLDCPTINPPNSEPVIISSEWRKYLSSTVFDSQQ